MFGAHINATNAATATENPPGNVVQVAQQLEQRTPPATSATVPVAIATGTKVVDIKAWLNRYTSMNATTQQQLLEQRTYE